MKAYTSQYSLISGTSHAEVIRKTRYEYHKIQKRTPRRIAYVRSAYFSKDKVFINQFWDHLKQKRPNDQLRRAKYYLCAIDLIRNSTLLPETIIEKTLSTQFHRFKGKTKDGQYYFVQIKHNIKTGRKDFMSVFPIDNFKRK